MITFYPRLIEAVIELKRHVRRTLAENKGVPYKETSSAYSTFLGRGFTIELDVESDTYYCLTDG